MRNGNLQFLPPFLFLAAIGFVHTRLSVILPTLSNMNRFFISFLLALLFSCAYGQQTASLSFRFSVDSTTFTEKNVVHAQGKTYHLIKLADSRSIIKGEVFLQDTLENTSVYFRRDATLDLPDTASYLIDGNKLEFSFALEEGKAFFRGDLVLEQRISLSHKAKTTWTIPLFIYCNTAMEKAPEVYDVFQEEDLYVELPGINVWNIHTDGAWHNTEEMDYRYSKQLNSIKFQVRPHLLGHRSLTIPISTLNPILQEDGSIGTKLETLELRLNVKPNRIDFLSFDRDEVFFDPTNPQNGDEIQMRYSPGLLLKKTYRVENQQEPGGLLIAELYVRSILANGKVLCWLRPFSLHRISEGYLYIKDGDRTRFITNLSILAKPKIDQMQVMRKNEDWSDRLYARPGEQVTLKIQGRGLQKARIELIDLPYLVRDSISQSDEVAFYRLTIPKDVSKKKFTVFLNNQVTAFDLMIKEYQEPRPFDYIKITYGDESATLDNERFDKPVLYGKLLKDITFSFDNDKIDQGTTPFGKQYLDIDIKIVSPRGELKETFHTQIVVCPGERSIRYDDYDRSDCENSVVSLNDLLNNKTFNLEGYSQIFIKIKNNRAYYGAAGYNRSVKIILKRNVIFDLQVSFPAGLLIKRFDQPGIGGLSGISIAAFAQFSFYDPLQVGKIKPYKLGGGFLAVNAFNFSDNTNVLRDVATVAIASFYPVNRNSKFSFPLHTGVGFLMKQGAWFFMFGPGIVVSF